ncbi:MAG TPA: hypothetical protein PLH27_03675 [bacterium]|nr:hypothetical protein [bacterium]HMZ04713.1 hypothetical protein [bacterium]HNB10671.1 hypothetical protein [bacterium]HNB56640.1 hypothetical protein [bacterium]HNC48060.1 hypothetical protein [bacterium]
MVEAVINLFSKKWNKKRKKNITKFRAGSLRIKSNIFFQLQCIQLNKNTQCFVLKLEDFMEIKAEKLETKNPTEMSVGDWLILIGAGMMVAGGFMQQS